MDAPFQSSNTSLFDVFEPNDKTALVCMDVPEMERLAVQQVRELGYKVHTGTSADDLVFKQRLHPYDLLLLAENYGGTTVATNPVLAAALRSVSNPQHRQIVVLVGATFATADEMQAFQHSVHLVVNLSDVVNLRPLIRRAALKVQEFYQRYADALVAADVA
jgi:CheY-like chemotaxis protein